MFFRHSDNGGVGGAGACGAQGPGGAAPTHSALCAAHLLPTLPSSLSPSSR